MKKRTIQQYAIAIVISLGIFTAGVFSQGLFQETSLQEIYGCLSDCFLFPAVFVGGIGALTWIAGEGAFDMLGYGVNYMMNKFLHPKDAQEGFYEYKMRKADGQKPWLKEWLIVGLICFCISIIFLLLYLAQG